LHFLKKSQAGHSLHSKSSLCVLIDVSSIFDIKICNWALSFTNHFLLSCHHSFLLWYDQLKMVTYDL
jgi:hypothetical protein